MWCVYLYPWQQQTPVLKSKTNAPHRKYGTESFMVGSAGEIVPYNSKLPTGDFHCSPIVPRLLLQNALSPSNLFAQTLEFYNKLM